MKENYTYPLDPDWSAAQIIKVMRLYNLVEKAYEGQLDCADFQNAWRDYTSVVPAKMDQRHLEHEFEIASGYSVFQVFKAVKNSTRARVTLKGYDERNRYDN